MPDDGKRSLGCYIYCLQVKSCLFWMAVMLQSFAILLLIGATNEENANSELGTFGVLQRSRVETTLSHLYPLT